MNTVSSEEKLAYRSGVFPNNRPDRMGAVAALRGLFVENAECPRVLELGCGNGVTLLSIAHSMPLSECLGVDLLTERISEARTYADQIGLDNISFIDRDVNDLDTTELGEFDFIIAHGLYSWVPEAVRERVLLIYRECLRPNGVGLISYNTYPGWHLRNIVREAMLFGSDPNKGQSERAADAIEFVRKLAGSIPEDSIYRVILNHETEAAANKDLSILVHDEMCEFTTPFYFETFAGDLEKAGLKYIAEVGPRKASARGRDDPDLEGLDSPGNDPIRREQLFDLLHGTCFRSSLVCRAECEISYEPSPESLERLCLAANVATSSEVSLTDNSEVAFTLSSGTSFSTNHRFTKSMLGLLGRSWPRRKPFEEISDQLRSEFTDLAEGEFPAELLKLKEFTLKLINTGMVEAGIFQPAFSDKISSRPKASAFARWQADTGWEYVTNMFGAGIRLDNDLIRALIVTLDGTRTVDEIPTGILELLSMPKDDAERLRMSLPEFVEAGLHSLKEKALLVD